jgi:peptidyl-prolyl cis-trans isomerase D
MTEATFREIQADAQKAAAALVKVKTYPNNARAALGLEPLDPKKDAKAPKTEKAK